jgi:hypothetical protein
MKLCGIDPGKSGAIVELDLREKTCRWMVLPWREDALLDEYRIKLHFDFSEAHYIYIEKVTPNKLFGCSNFTFGMNYMAVLSMIGQAYPYQLVSPKAWQRKFNGNTDNEKAAKLRTASSFRKMNPSFGGLVRSKHEGLIDAFFIAYYAGIVNNVVMPVDFNFIELS